ncbi:MAG: MmcQ/YjbR family DNA-binding protein [Myxococcales bacterium]
MEPQSKPTAAIAKAYDSLREHGLAYPETHEDHPWGHSALKVKGKAFAFLWADGEGLSISAKLPVSNDLALNLPFAQPTGYGLGKSGWVSGKFGSKDKVPLELLFAWLEESYRSIAPKKLSALLGGAVGTTRLPGARAEEASGGPAKGKAVRRAGASKGAKGKPGKGKAPGEGAKSAKPASARTTSTTGKAAAKGGPKGGAKKRASKVSSKKAPARRR